MRHQPPRSLLTCWCDAAGGTLSSAQWAAGAAWAAQGEEIETSVVQTALSLARRDSPVPGSDALERGRVFTGSLTLDALGLSTADTSAAMQAGGALNLESLGLTVSDLTEQPVDAPEEISSRLARILEVHGSDSVQATGDIVVVEPDGVGDDDQAPQADLQAQMRARMQAQIQARTAAQATPSANAAVSFSDRARHAGPPRHPHSQPDPTDSISLDDLGLDLADLVDLSADETRDGAGVDESVFALARQLADDADKE